MAKNHPILKKIVTLFFLLFAISAFSQSAGDFRSKATGSWTATSSWQTYNGITWVDATSYPGQNPGTYIVNVQTGHTVSILSNLITASIGSVVVNGTLNLVAGTAPKQITLSTLLLKISGGLVQFDTQKTELYLPENSVIQIDNGGNITGACSNNTEIYIGTKLIAVCTGGGGGTLTFGEVVTGGGTINAEIMTPMNNPSLSCLGQVINLIGKYNGTGTGVTYTWTVTDPDNLSVGGITQTGSLVDNSATTTSTSFTTAKTGNYIVSLSVTGGGFTNIETKTITVGSINTWNGNGANSNWNNPLNWCSGVPSSTNTLDIVIPSGLTNYPTIYTSDVAEVVNIVIESGATLYVVDNYLKVTGNLTLNGKIDLNGESQLVQGPGSNLIGTGSIEIDQQGTGNKYRYNYWSMPVSTATESLLGIPTNYTTISASLRDGTNPNSPGTIIYNNSGYDGSISPFTLSTYWMYKYANSGSGYSAWNQVRSTGPIYSGQGFTMKGPGAPGSPEQNYVFVGKPNNGNINLTVAKDYDYLVGNPYPSAIDADQFLYDNGPSGTASITGAIYFWEHYGGDTHNLAGYQGGYATYSYGGGSVPAASFPGLGGGISVKGAPAPYIPVGQAFFVVGDAIDGGQIQFNNGQRVFKKESLGDAIFMKNSSTKAKRENTPDADFRPKFRIGFDAAKISHRQLLLTIDERATPELDWGFDAEIYEVFADDMYWMLNNKKYVIQGTNNVALNSEVPLGIQLSKTGLVTVKIDELENVDDDTSVYLKDKVTGESFNMREKPVQLNLVAGKYADRFVLVFKTQKLITEDVNAEILIPAIAQPIIEGIHVFMNNTLGELQIKNNSAEEIVGVALINAVGQTIKTWNSNFNIRTISLPISIPTGVYLVHINTKTGKTVKKISVE